MIGFYTVTQPAPVLEASANNGTLIVGSPYVLHLGSVIAVDTAHVIIDSSGSSVVPNTIFLIHVIPMQGPAPSSTSVFTDQAIPVGLFDPGNEDQA